MPQMSRTEPPPQARESLPPQPETPRPESPRYAEARFGIGDVVRHRVFPFRGVIFDVDPEFANTEEWWEAIPEEIRPRKDQPFYHLLAENEESAYVAYVSQQNLLLDDEDEPVRHPAVSQIFDGYADGRYILKPASRN
ncbi:heat shock protein HspQ [Sandaracinobacteroides hominis]|uniref:heat shock protein HspQ n=1 Tax=Sandaracinobacteroides hominis TaxID=2780086 RepID=UPI0018F49C65|nr:heat shock protein HspQ [Sandaracinobacteroides hominis]